MPAVTLEYPELVSVSGAGTQVDLVEVNAGHRVQLPITVTVLETMFGYNVANNAMAVPLYKMSKSDLQTAIGNCITNIGFNDIDSVTGGLDFSSSIYDGATTGHTDLRQSTKAANDLVLAYVLYKTFGSSGIKTDGLLTDPTVTHGMLITDDFSSAIHDSLVATAGVAGVVVMFNDLVSSDIARFQSGTTTNPGIQGGGGATTPITDDSGSWAFVAGDIIDIKVEFSFISGVTLKTENSLDAAASKISANDKFKIRLQLLATAAT